MYLVRKITRAKWERRDQLADGEIPADAVTADLRTSENALSLWTSVDFDGSGLNDAILALAAGAERVDKIDVVWLEQAQFGETELEQSDGKTPVLDLVDRHVDAVRLDLVRLGRFAKQVVHALDARQHKRLTKKKVAQLIAAAVDDGRVPLAELGEKVQNEVSKYVERIE